MSDGRRVGRTRPARRATLADAAFAALCVLVAILRILVLTEADAPSSVDAGNWLALGEDALGPRLRSSSIVYPPVVPLLVTGAVRLLGAVHGVALVAAAAALAPPVVVYLVLRQAPLGWRAVPLAGLLATASSTGEAAAWGGYPQLIGLGLLLAFLAALDRWLASPRPGSALAAALLLAALLLTTHLMVAAAVVASAVLASVHLLATPAGRRRHWFVAVARNTPLVVLPSLPLVPLYLGLAGRISIAGHASPAGARLAPGNLVTSVEFLYRDFEIFWRLAFVAGALTPLLLIDRWQTPLWRLSTSLIAATAGLALATAQPRVLYLLPVAIVLSIALWSWDLAQVPHGFLRQAGGALTAALVVGCAIQAVVGLRFFAQQRDYYGVVSPGVAAALDWTSRHTPSDAVVAVTTARNDAPLGWWVEGLARRRTRFASSLHWLNFEDERRRARIANDFFAASPFPGPAVIDLARRSEVDFILVSKEWAGYDMASFDRFRGVRPELFVFENAASVILEVG